MPDVSDFEGPDDRGDDRWMRFGPYVPRPQFAPALSEKERGKLSDPLVNAEMALRYYREVTSVSPELDLELGDASVAAMSRADVDAWAGVPVRTDPRLPENVAVVGAPNWTADYDAGRLVGEPWWRKFEVSDVRGSARIVPPGWSEFDVSEYETVGTYTTERSGVLRIDWMDEKWAAMVWRWARWPRLGKWGERLYRLCVAWAFVRALVKL